MNARAYRRWCLMKIFHGILFLSSRRFFGGWKSILKKNFLDILKMSIFTFCESPFVFLFFKTQNLWL